MQQNIIHSGLWAQCDRMIVAEDAFWWINQTESDSI